MLLRKGHPFVRGGRRGKALLETLQELEYVAVRTHAETLRILQLLNLEDRVASRPSTSWCCRPS